MVVCLEAASLAAASAWSAVSWVGPACQDLVPAQQARSALVAVVAAAAALMELADLAELAGLAELVADAQ